jgi:Tol biopolymer transport system component
VSSDLPSGSGMRLTPGSEIASFRIVSAIGAGGMGEVYLAQDTRLGREVALKVLPDAFAHDRDRRSRFEREARVLASLNHPNIATLHGLREADGRAILEMEFVSGETLADRLRRGPLSIPETLSVFNQIAQALDAAHDRGVVHRDLKPANIKITADGRVKVLDFGLAKAFSTEGSGRAEPLSVTSSQSQPGMIVGTTRYMSPEQARGQVVDRRSDIWSFGCVLFECLAGRPAFLHDTTSDTIAAILREEPDWNMLVGPVALQRLVRRCLRKDVQSRLRDIADARLELEELMQESALWRTPLHPVRARVNRRTVVAAAALAVTTVALLAWATRFITPTSPPTPAARVTVSLPADQQLMTGPSPSLAISPDGRSLVYVAVTPGARTHLYRRSLDAFEASRIAGTEGATGPFFSHDGNWVGFYARDALQRVSLDGGVPLKICDAPPISGATWLADGTIVFGTTLSGDGLWRVSVDGGTPQPLTKPDAARKEHHHVNPHALPDGLSALFVAATDQGFAAAVLSIEARTWRVLPQVRPTAGSVQFASSGHLVFAQGAGLAAIPFDVERGQSTGSLVAIPERLATAPETASTFVLSASGTLAYVPGRTEVPRRTMVSVDREGRVFPFLAAPAAPAAYAQPRFSPDGRWLAITLESESGADVWRHDLQRGTRTRLTTTGAAGFPAWSPDSAHVAFYDARSGPWSLFTRVADGSLAAEAVLTGSRPDSAAAWSHDPAEKLLPGFAPTLSGANPQYPMSWTPDGRTLAFTERKPNGERDIWVIERGQDPTPFLLTPADEWSPAFSPDGRWLAYVSDESGRNEVYIQPYPGPGGRWLISTDGGTDPVWAPKGDELYYLQGDQMMAVAIQATATISAGAPRRLFEGRYERSGVGRNYDLSPDGKRFVMIRSEERDTAARVHVVLNWLDELRSGRKP